MTKVFINKFNFILPVILCGNLFAAQEVSRESSFNIFPSKDRVQFKKDIISKDKEFGKKIVYTAVGLSAFACGIIIYKTVEYFLKKEDIVKNKTLSCSELTKRMFKLEAVLERTADPKFFSRQWFKKVGEVALTSVAGGIVSGAITPVVDSFYKRYSCLDNLNNFCDNKAKSVVNLEELLSDAEIIDALKDSDDSEHEQYLKDYKFKFNLKIRNLVDELEGIVAFMEQKLDSIDNVILTEEDLLIPSHLFEATNNYCNSLKNFFEGKKNSLGLHDFSAMFFNEVIGLVEIFGGVEARLEWLNRG